MLFQFAGKFHDQDGILRRQPHQHEQRDLREHIVVATGQFHAKERAENRHRHDQDHGQRQGPAFVLGGQHQEHQQHAQREDIDHRIAGQDVLVGQLRPFIRNPLRQHFLGDALQRGLCLAARYARGGAAIEIGCGVGVVALHAVRTIAILDAHQGGQRDHFALVTTHLQLRDILRM